jgi:hypothetical protein
MKCSWVCRMFLDHHMLLRLSRHHSHMRQLHSLCSQSETCTLFVWFHHNDRRTRQFRCTPHAYQWEPQLPQYRDQRDLPNGMTHTDHRTDHRNTLPLHRFQNYTHCPQHK